MSQSEVLREYLISLGFRVNQTDFKKFGEGIDKTDLSLLSLAKRAAAGIVAVQTLATVFARSMEKLYYASQRTDAAVGNLQALEFAGTRAGVSGDAIRAAIEGLARSLRNNPGLKGFLHDLQIPVEGRDTADVMKDLVAQLRQMPFYKARQIAEMFGMDETTYLMLSKNIDKFTEAYNLRKKMAQEAGLDEDALAKQGMEFSNTMDSITTKIGIFSKLVLRDLLPGLKGMADSFDRGLSKFIKWWGDHSTEANKINAKGGMSYFDFTKKFWSAVGDKVMGGTPGAAPGKQRATGTVTPAQASAPMTPATRQERLAYLSNLENKFGLPAGYLQKIWATESAEGTRMLSPRGAKGHFQFMDATAADLGLKNPFDFVESAQAAARYLSTLFARYGGDARRAVGAYNWGLGNMDKFGMGFAPPETQNYVRKVMGGDTRIEQNNTFTIHSPDPMTTASRVGGEMDRVNSTLTRNKAGAVE